MGVWAKVFPPKDAAGRVLGSCDSKEVHCAESRDSRLTIAAFLQHHGKSEEEADTATLRIAYRTYHPEPISFRRTVECFGGMLSEYDPDETLQLASGRTSGRPYLEAMVPDGINVTRGANGAQVNLTMQAMPEEPVELKEILTILFPDRGRPACPCC
jgi:hypothetical protein